METNSLPSIKLNVEGNLDLRDTFGLVLRKLSSLGHVTAEPDISEDQLGLSSAPGSRHAGPAQMSATG